MSSEKIVFAAPPKLVVIGASAGALEALLAFLPLLPENYPLPVAVVVHLPPERNSVLAELLNAQCRVEVREAEDKEPLHGNTVFVAPPDYHLMVEARDRLSLSADDPVLFSRPSIDVLFESAATIFGAQTLGIVLTGASSDGANGARAIREAGGNVVVQSPELARSAAMPQAALDRAPGAQPLSLPEIAELLVAVGRREL